MKPSRKLYKRLEVLRRRRDFLVDKISKTDTDIHPAYDIAELSAIEFAIEFIEANRELALQKIAEDKLSYEMDHGLPIT